MCLAKRPIMSRYQRLRPALYYSVCCVSIVGLVCLGCVLATAILAGVLVRGNLCASVWKYLGTPITLLTASDIDPFISLLILRFPYFPCGVRYGRLGYLGAHTECPRSIPYGRQGNQVRERRTNLFALFSWVILLNSLVLSEFPPPHCVSYFTQSASYRYALSPHIKNEPYFAS